jgi:hypothetical protein
MASPNQVLATLESFDEGGYLAANPDVAQAVAQGKIGSGRDHFEQFGRREGRKQQAPGAVRTPDRPPAMAGKRPLRPYEEKLLEAGEQGIVLKRSDIYGSGPPVNVLSGGTQDLLRRHGGQSIVDLGAGCGALQQYLPKGTKYLGIESSVDAVAMAASLGRNVVVGDALATGLPDDSYEVSAMMEVLEHIDDYMGALTEARRVCSSRFIMTVPNIGVIPAMSEHQVVPWHLLEATHVNFFTPDSLRKVLERVFARVEVWEINQWFKPGLYMNIAAVAWK